MVRVLKSLGPIGVLGLVDSRVQGGVYKVELSSFKCLKLRS